MHPQHMTTPQSAAAVVEHSHPRATEMAEVMITNYRQCDAGVLRNAGFSQAEIDRYADEAKMIARNRFMRDDTPPDYDRAERIKAASRRILSLCPDTMAIVGHLQACGFTKPELDDILDEAIATAANTFAAGDMASA